MMALEKALESGTPQFCYDHMSGAFYMQVDSENWIRCNESAAKRSLQAAGVRVKKEPDEAISPSDDILEQAQRQRFVKYVGCIAGMTPGIHTVGENRILVPQGMKRMKLGKGEWPTLKMIFEGLLADPDGHPQLDYFYGWLKVACEGFYQGHWRPGQALCLAGPPGCGKSLTQNLITEILGGRCAKPYQYMTGVTGFNSHLFEACHLMVEDEAASTDIKARRKFGSEIKNMLFNDYQNCHAKGRTAITLPIVWRLSISVNDEPENLLVLPPFEESNMDKIMLLHAHKFSLPDGMDQPGSRKALWEKLMAELPAFVHWLLNEHVIDKEMVNERCGVKAFLHPVLTSAVDNYSPEVGLLVIIDDVLWQKDQLGCVRSQWIGTANELKKLLVDQKGREAENLLQWRNSTGTLLGRLQTKAEYSHRLKSDRLGHDRDRVWTIFSPTFQHENQPY